MTAATSVNPLTSRFSNCYAAGGSSDDLAVLGMLLSPEAVKEAQRVRGAALALTGLDRPGAA